MLHKPISGFGARRPLSNANRQYVLLRQFGDSHLTIGGVLFRTRIERMDLSRKCDSQVPSGCRSGLKIGVELDLLAGEDVVRFDGQVAAVGDSVDVDQEGVAGKEAFQRGFATEAVDGEVGVAIDGSDAGVGNIGGGPLVVYV